MQKIIVTIFFIGLFGYAEDFKSTHLKKFEVSQCFEKGCLRSVGDLGFISMSGDTISSSSVTVEFFNTKKPMKPVHCASFRLDFKAQFLTCDNRDRPGTESLTIDSGFEILTYKL